MKLEQVLEKNDGKCIDQSLFIPNKTKKII